MFTVTPPRVTGEGAPADAATQPIASEVADDRLRGLHVLAVDDDGSTLGMLAEMLALGGATVSTAQSVPAALAILRDNAEISVLLSDIGMPDRDGYDLVESLRRDHPERAARVTAVALTGYVRDEDHAHALRAGFDAHLAKPFGMDALFETIAGLVAQRRPQESTAGRGAAKT